MTIERLPILFTAAMLVASAGCVAPGKGNGAAPGNWRSTEATWPVPAEERGKVLAGHEDLTLPWYETVTEALPPKKPGGKPRRKSHQERRGNRTFRCLFLKNDFLHLRIIPDLAGQVHDATFRPTGDDLFYCEELAKSNFAFLQSGVRGSFPKAEHGMWFFGQPASCRVVEKDDGAVTVAMWMEFSRYRGGGYTPLLLHQCVTLRPNEALFSVTYRLVNPCIYRMGRLCWNDAFWPRTHNENGVIHGKGIPPETTTTEWVYPASHVSFHRGQQFRRYDRAAEEPLQTARTMYNSVFGWDMPFGFAGLWYPRVSVHRLRIWDPSRAPGAKQFYHEHGKYTCGTPGHVLHNLVEFWGGTDCVFEGVENWLGPGEAWEFTHRFCLLRGIGKVDFADARVAVNVEFGKDGRGVEVITHRPVAQLEAVFKGRSLGAPVACGPAQPARFPLPADAEKGRLVLNVEGETVLDRQFPLEIPDNDERYPHIRESLNHRSPHYAEKSAGADLNTDGYRRALKTYPYGSVDRGRILYRDGRIDAAVECLSQAVEVHPDDGEGAYLLGAALIEQGKDMRHARDCWRRAANAATPFTPARYLLAIDSIQRGKQEEAVRGLQFLVEQLPNHWEGRLLLAWLEGVLSPDKGGSTERAETMAREDPADLRVQYVLWKGAETQGNAALAAAAKAGFDALMQGPGAARRLEEFQAATRGEFLPPRRRTP